MTDLKTNTTTRWFSNVIHAQRRKIGERALLCVFCIIFIGCTSGGDDAHCTCGFQPAVAQTAAVAVAAAVLVGHIRGGRVRVHRGWIGVAQGAAVGRAARKGAFMLVLADTVQAVHWVYMRQARGVLLVCRVSVAELQEGGF